ncbi:MAG: ABC-2 family transporter protein [Alphaproteobacteria bacterium]|nr:ABC-2 family transporter protein [Alphaproteobacteria bacterium]
MNGALRTWGSVVRLGVLHHFAWRLDVVIALLSATMVLVLNGSVWEAVADGQSRLGTLTPVELSTYVVIAWCASRVTATRVDENLGQRHASGQLATDLLKPLDLPSYLLARDVGRAAVAAVVTALPLLALGAWWFPLAWPRQPVTWALVAGSVALGVAVGGQIGLLVGMASFRLRRVTGLVSLKEVATALLSGALVPVTLMPDAAAHAVMVLPFAALAHVPAWLFLERATGAEALGLLVAQAAWAAILAVVVRLSWWRALRHLTVEGG